MAENTKLEPCPFCGGYNVHVIDRTCDRNTPYNPTDYAYPRVLCRCGAGVAGEDWTGKETAIAAWNRRAPSPIEAPTAAWRAHYDRPEHLGADLRMLADNTDERAGFATMNASILRRAAVCFDSLPEAATHSEALASLRAAIKQHEER